MGVTEEAGKAVGGFFEVMQHNPLSLALVVMNFALIGILYYQSALFTEQRRENVRMFIDVQKEVQKLLSQCIVPQPTPGQRSLIFKDLLGKIPNATPIP